MQSFFFRSFKIFFGFFAISLLFSGSGCRPMCPIPTCNVRMVHKHEKAEFRGSKWYKKQNPKIGEKLPKPTVEQQSKHNDRRTNRK